MRYKRKTDIYGDEQVLDTKFNDYLSINEIIRKLNELDELSND